MRSVFVACRADCEGDAAVHRRAEVLPSCAALLLLALAAQASLCSQLAVSNVWHSSEASAQLFGFTVALCVGSHNKLHKLLHYWGLYMACAAHRSHSQRRSSAWMSCWRCWPCSAARTRKLATPSPAAFPAARCCAGPPLLRICAHYLPSTVLSAGRHLHGHPNLLNPDLCRPQNAGCHPQVFATVLSLL